MVIPLCSLVAHLVHQGFEPVVHGLWLFPLVKHEATELPLDRLPLGDYDLRQNFDTFMTCLTSNLCNVPRTLRVPDKLSSTTFLPSTIGKRKALLGPVV
jgi:hypothetical protein